MDQKKIKYLKDCLKLGTEVAESGIDRRNCEDTLEYIDELEGRPSKAVVLADLMMWCIKMGTCNDHRASEMHLAYRVIEEYAARKWCVLDTHNIIKGWQETDEGKEATERLLENSTNSADYQLGYGLGYNKGMFDAQELHRLDLIRIPIESGLPPMPEKEGDE